MNPYPSAYPQQGYGPQYPPIVPPPNQFYAPPAVANHQNGYNGYNSYPATSYQSYRRPSDPGPRPQGPARQLSRRHATSRRASEDEDARHRPQISQPTRPRNNSTRAGITPDYIFISLSSHDIIKITNLKSMTLLDEMRQTLLRFWPHGIVDQSEDINEWSVKVLGGDVWTAGGEHAIDARRLIRGLFSFLAEEGFGYLATIDMGHPMKAPRMVFTSVPSEPQPEYFMISFSLNRRTLSIIDCPPDLSVLLGAALGTPPLPRQPHATTPQRNIESARWTAAGVYEVVTGARGTARQDLATLMSGALKLIAAEGYRFEASVPFGKAGFLGLRGRREVWMFRRIAPPKPNRIRHR